MDSSRYLITGGCGFIGSNLVSFLRAKGIKVRILDDLSSGKRENIPEDAELIVGDITDKDILKGALEGISGCFHLAARASVEKSLKEWRTSHYINQFGTVNLIETIVESKKRIPIIFASSAAVYGEPKNLPLKESDPSFPESPYGIDKKGSEEHLKMAWKYFQIPSVSFRFFNVYGPKQDPLSPYSGAISIFAKKIKDNETITIFGDGENIRDYIFVEDIVEALWCAMQLKIEGALVFNLATGIGTSVNQIVKTLEKILKSQALKVYAEPRKGDVLVSMGDKSNVKAFLGWEAKTSLEKGLSKLLSDEL